MAQELKEHLFVPYSELREGDELTDDFAVAKTYYLKSDVDKVLAKLEEIQSQKMQLEDDIALLRRNNAELKKQVHDYVQGLYVDEAMGEKELRHQNYKRCLANAWWCRNLSKTYAWSAYNHRGWKIGRYYDEKAELYRKWRKRWLELAEKFKEAK